MADIDLVTCSDILGKSVLDPASGKIGVIREIFLDKATGEARFAVIDVAGLFGDGKLRPLPWRLLHVDAQSGDYVTPLTKDRLKEAPGYDRDQLGSSAYGWSDQVERFFEANPAAA